jgi:hypothetical protein
MTRLSREEAKALFRAKPDRAEERIHIAVVEYLRFAAPGLVWFHVPNGGRRDPGEAAKLKQMGVRAGVPDLVFVLPDGRSAFVELKSDAGTLEPEQAAFFDAIPVEVPRAVCRSIDDVERALLSWGVTLKARAGSRHRRAA